MQHFQSFLPRANKSHSAPISIFMAKIGDCKYKEILQSGGLLTGKVHNISSCIEYRNYKQVQFIKSRKYRASVWYNKCLTLFQHLMMCLACTPYLVHADDALHFVPKILITTDDMPHLYCVSLFMLHILHIGCTWMKRNNRPAYLKPAFCFCEAHITYVFRLFVNERGISR